MSRSINSRAIAGTFFTNLSLQGCSLVTGILTARLLLPAGRGELAAIILWPSILDAIGILGIDWVLGREVAAAPEKESDLARHAVLLGLVLGGLTMLAGYFLIPFLLPEDKEHLIWLSRLYLLFIPFSFIATNLLALESGRMRWHYYNWMRLTYVIPYALIIVGFWAVRYQHVDGFVLALLLSTIITAFIRVILRRREIALGRVQPADTKRIMAAGLPFTLATASYLVGQQMDRTLAVSLLSVDNVGYYAAALTFASIHLSLGSALGIASFVALANEPDKDRQGAFLAQMFRQSTLLYLVAGSGVALLAPFLIVPLFGPGFAPAVQPTIILALATSLTSLGNILNEGLRGRGINYPGIAGHVLGGAILALMAWILIPHFGLMGIAGAAMLGALGRFLVLLVAVVLLFNIAPGQLWGFNREELRAISRRLYHLIPAVKS
jgi:O-antigen/teichoic acid export membrane protein